jgi:serine/threonine protein kinase
MAENSSILDCFEIIKTVGYGVTSKVKLARNLETGELRALKILKSAKSLSTKAEIDFFRSVPNHANIIQFAGYKADSRYIRKFRRGTMTVSYLDLEFAARGEIFEFVENLGAFPEPIARFYYKQLLSALDHIHRSGIAHRDIKPENIFLDKDYNLKIADFGFSTFLQGRSGDGIL